MIEIINLTKSYGDKPALDHVSFSVKDGEILGLLGLNGAGKSTTMNIMTGYIGADEGSVKINGFDMMKEPMRAKACLGYLPEQPPLYVDMRVCEYLDFVCGLKGIKVNREEHIAEICREAGIDHMKKRVIRNLSKGYKQRVGLAQALVGNPKVLVLDEPTSGLDPSQIIEIRSLIRRLGETRTVVISSHILPELQEVCHKVVVLHQGKMVADDTPENLARAIYEPSRVEAWICGDCGQVEEAVRTYPLDCRVTVGAEKEPGVFEYRIDGAYGSDIRADVFRAMAKADLPMLAIRGSEVSLEDIFLKLVEKRGEV